MNKIVSMPSTMGDYMDLSRACMENNKFLEAIPYLKSAEKLAKKEKDKKKISIELAKVYAARFKYGYSNELLYRLMSKYPDDAEIKIMMLINMLSLNDRDLAQYYYDSVKDYIKTKKVFASQIVDDMVRLEVDMTGKNLEKDDAIDFDLEEILKEPPQQNTFTMINDSVRFDQYIDKICACINEGSYGEAIDLANEALKLKVNNQQKKIAIYSKAMALLILGYVREAKDLCEKTLDEYGDDLNIRLLYCQTLVDSKDKEGLKKAISSIIEAPDTEFMQFHRICQILIKGGLLDEAKNYLKKLIKDNPDSYSYNAYLGIIYFNEGDKEKARRIFAQLNGLYGDLATAKHFLNYIDSEETKPIPVEAVNGDWKELTMQYVTKFYSYLEMSDVNFREFLKNNYEEIVYEIKWLSTGMRAKPVFGLISKIFELDKEDLAPASKIVKAKRAVLALCSTVPFFDRYTQIHIISECIHYGFETKIPVLCDGKFYTVDTLSVYYMDFSVTFADAFANALAISATLGEEEFNKVKAFMENFKDMMCNHQFRWRNVNTIVVFILETALQKRAEDLNLNFEYGERQLQKYTDDYNEAFKEDYILGK